MKRHVYVEEWLPFPRDLSLEYFQDSYLYFRLALLDSVTFLLFLYKCCWCYLLANVFVFKDLNFHYKDWPILVELVDLVNSAIIFLAQTNFLSLLTFLLNSWRWYSQSYSFWFISILWHSCWLRSSLWSTTVRDIPWDDIFKQGALMLVTNFVSTSSLELICITLIVNIRSSLIHFHGSQLILLLP